MEKDWDFKKNQPKKSCPDREAIVKLISDKVSVYNSLIMELTAKQQEFTVSSLVQMIENKVAVKTVSEMYDYLIDEFRKTDHLGTMSVYQQSKSSLAKFNRTLDIPFSDIDCQWLERYEKWLKGRNIKDTTISILFRTLRSVFNRALKVSKFDVRTKKRIVLPENVSTLGLKVFANCSKLASIYIKNVNPPTLGSDLGISKSAKIYVPKESVELYKSGWSQYASQIVGYDFTE